MSFVKMSPSSWSYYAKEVASGREDYYASAADRPGRFVGRGAEALGLSELAMSAEALERLFGHGTDPRDGSPLGRSFAPGDDRVVAGFAMTFAPPKTVSVLWATADEKTSAVVQDAHEQAVEVAMGFLDDHASFTRRGHNGILQVDTEGFVGAVFVHRTSRAADPQLHTHLLVANKVRASDGKWLAIDARELFTHQKAAGMLYKAALRAELTTCLGLSWTKVDDNGVAEIEGVPVGLADAWSARRKELKQWADELIAEGEADLGRSMTPNERAEIFQLAAYRTPKIDADTTTDELRERWQQEATAFGHDPTTWLGEVTGKVMNVVNQRIASRQLDTGLITEAIARLQDSSATFGRADAVEVLSTIVSANDANSMKVRIETLATKVLRDPRVVSLAGPLPAVAPASLRRRDGMSAIERHGATRFSTKVTLEREAKILEAAAKGLEAGVGVVDRHIVDATLNQSSLGEDQRRAVRGLLTGGEQMAILVGPAGAGKSRALNTARTTWEMAGYRTLGLAPSAMAASVLSEEAGLRTETLAKFLLEIDHQLLTGPDGPSLHHRSVVILDEAGMARTDDLARLVEVVRRADAKLVLVGDPHQLGAVGPGGIFRTLVGDHDVNELETIHRFNHAWEAQASLRLRARDHRILPVYLRHGRIADGNREQMLDEAFRHWRSARDEGASIVVMAGDNETARELGLRCRADRIARSEVTQHGVQIQSGTVGIGDEIVTLRNDRRLRPSPDDFVRNGDRWRVLDYGGDGSLRVESLRGESRANRSTSTVILPGSYVRDHVALGYALTIHKAQGMTTDRAVVIVDEQMTAPQLYVAMSRGREENHALVVSTDIAIDDHDQRPSVSAIELLAGVMRREGQDRSAHDVMRSNLNLYDNVVLLRDLLEEARQMIDREAGPDHTKEIASLTPRADVEAARTRLDVTARDVRSAQQHRQQAEDRVSECEHTPLRAKLPGQRGVGARIESNNARIVAGRLLREAQSRERSALKEYESAQSRLNENLDAARELAVFQDAQRTREEWLGEHPNEVRWANELEERLLERHEKRSAGGTEKLTGRVRPAGPSKAKAVVTARGLEALPLDQIESLIRDRQIRQPDSGYFDDEVHRLGLPQEVRGPVIGR
ncbi:MAG TPA: MobF family relaxase [Acidimicrobiales bacterium]|nr:MobF family relaxase [Acidimicrobiales bacterium]